MSVAKNTLKGSSFLTGSEIVNQACAMARNIILARFLTKEDFGVASLLGLILTLFEMTSKMALGQQLVQSKHGDERPYVDSVHFTQLVLGITSTLLILAFAWPLAHFVAGPRYVGSLFLLAVVPLVNGFIHLEIYRRTRRQSYGPSVLAEMIPQILTTLAAWPLTVFFKDYRAVLWLLLGRSILFVAITHLFAERRFHPRYNRSWLTESLKFGWPLLLAGFVQMGNFQGDSMVVAAGYPLSQLGEYSVALTMAMTPSVALLRVSHSVTLPLLSEVQSELPKLIERYSRYVEILALLSCAATLGMIFCGEQVIVLFYGAKYAGIGTLACLLTGAQGLRIVRGASVGAFMARGDTINILLTNIWRLSGLGLAALVGWLHGSLSWFALTAFAGEVVALVVAMRQMSVKHQIPFSATAKPTLIAVTCVIGAAAFRRLIPGTAPLWLNWPALAFALTLTGAAFMLVLSPLRALATELLYKFNSRIGSPLPASWLTPKVRFETN